LNHKELEHFVRENELQLYVDQHYSNSYDVIFNSIENQFGTLLFVNGLASTCKTFLFNVVVANVQSQEKIVICIVSLGIVALLLDGGHIAHSTFKIPFQVNECSI
jgi:hypothetical protein